jgi:uncharacterized protein YbbC (DUF1343 family)
MRVSIKPLMRGVLLISVIILCICCKARNSENPVSDPESQSVSKIKVGAEMLNNYIPLLRNKRVGMVVNQTSVIGNVHLVDTLLSLKVNIRAIFAPEHGYKGNVERGQDIDNSLVEDLGIPVISIYGQKKKPSPEDLEDIDVMIFDMQDVGVRFFTYISTMHYVMEACAENDVKLVVLDRPNPLGYYVDGPVLDTAFQSFIGMHPVPVIHGMTIGEYAQMINGEGWLKDQIKCSLNVVKVENYNHQTRYQVPVSPSPNLPDMKSIYLYPSICFFEGAEVNEGRGTNTPFQVFGNPVFEPKQNAYTPVSKPGYSLHPRFEGQVCYGYNLSGSSLENLQRLTQLELKYLITFYNQYPKKSEFFNAEFFDLLAGSSKLREQIISGVSANDIRESWQSGIEQFKIIRQKYLLYNE